MPQSKIFVRSFMNALGVAAYVLVIAWLLTHAENFFGPQATMWGPFIMLLLLVLSVAVVGSLIFGKPALLYLDGNKKDAVTMLIATISLLCIITFFSLVILALCVITGFKPVV